MERGDRRGRFGGCCGAVGEGEMGEGGVDVEMVKIWRVRRGWIFGEGVWLVAEPLRAIEWLSSLVDIVLDFHIRFGHRLVEAT
jgi:hypothetical protein